jgi:hypothetical protein
MILKDLYLALIKKQLSRISWRDRHRIISEEQLKQHCPAESVAWLNQNAFVFERADRIFESKALGPGHGWPVEAETMVSMERLENIENCFKKIVDGNVPGDLLEAGVWRGGTCIFMRALLAAYGDDKRTVWVADSFQGLPKPDPLTYPQDGEDTDWGNLWRYTELAISLETVRQNFAHYGLLDNQVRFLPGWFRESLPQAPVERLALLRLDGDLYESTIVTLENLYPKISDGGFVLVDDYGAISACKQAVDDFRAKRSITEPILSVDWTGIFWQVKRG